MNNFGMGGHAASRGHSDEEVFGKAYDQRVILRLSLIHISEPTRPY